jgi:hypothetical protein
MGRKSKNKPFNKGKKYAFVVDGQCEIWYIQKLKENESIPVEISPELPQKKSISDQLKRVEELAKDYQKVFWIIDLDVLIRETYAGSNRIVELKNYLYKIKNNDYLRDVVIPIVNVPCLEFWYLLHFKSTTKYYDSCSNIEREFKKISALKDYEKSERYYKKPNNNIYSRLSQYLKTAIGNSSKLPEFNPDNYNVGLSEMDELFNHIEELKERFTP